MDDDSGAWAHGISFFGVGAEVNGAGGIAVGDSNGASSGINIIGGSIISSGAECAARTVCPEGVGNAPGISLRNTEAVTISGVQLVLNTGYAVNVDGGRRITIINPYFAENVAGVINDPGGIATLINVSETHPNASGAVFRGGVDVGGQMNIAGDVSIHSGAESSSGTLWVEGDHWVDVSIRSRGDDEAVLQLCTDAERGGCNFIAVDDESDRMTLGGSIGLVGDYAPNMTVRAGGGNIGIGTVNPYEKFHVDGKIRVEGNIIAVHRSIAGPCTASTEGSVLYSAKDRGLCFCNGEQWLLVDGGGLCDVCGNGGDPVPPEECDDGNNDNTDECLNTCRWADCGDGYVWNGHEECDDGNTDPGDGCNQNCQLE